MFLHARVCAARAHINAANIGSLPADLPKFRIHLQRYEDIVHWLEAHFQDLSTYDQHQINYLKSFREHDAGGMYQLAHRMMEAAPGSQEAIRLSAVNSTRLYRYNEAVQLWRRLDPRHGLMRAWPYYHRRLSWALHHLRKYRQELRVARQAQKQYPHDWEMTFIKVRALIALGKIDRALNFMDHATSRLDDDDIRRVRLHAAHECVAHGYSEVGRSLFQAYCSEIEQKMRVLEQNGPWAELFHWKLVLAWRLFDLEKYAESNSIACELSLQDTMNLNLKFLRGLLAAQRGDTVEARRISESIAAAMPDSLYRQHFYSYNLNRAWIAAWLGEKEEAMHLLVSCEYWPWPFLSCRYVYQKPMWNYPPYEAFIAPKG
jgi:hypothetical protein